MLEVVRNTYPGVDLQPGDKVEWVYQKGCFRLYKHPYQNTISKSYFATPECTIDGIKLNGKPVILIGIVGQLKNKGWVLELKQVDVILEDDLSFDISDRLDEAAKKAAKQAIKPICEIDVFKEMSAREEDGEGLPEGVSNVDYKVFLATWYENLEAAVNSGRSVTTLFTIPDGVTVYYPVWKDGSSTYTKARKGEVAYGRVGHPLKEGNIYADSSFYVTIDEEFKDKEEVTFGIKFVDAVWKDVVYGRNDDLSLDISVRLDEAAKFTAKQDIKPICEIDEVKVADEKYNIQDMAANYITRLLKEYGNILKTCPMCGAEAKIESNQVGTAFRVSCIKIHKCGLTQHWFDSEQKAILAWNRRSGVCGD